jgi:hypothetical protein
MWRTGPAAINRSAFNAKEAEAPAVPSILWLYTDGTKLGQTALEEGTIEFAEGLPGPGRYLMRLFASDSYELLADASFSIGGDAPPAISIARNDNGTITVTFQGKLQSAPAVNGPWQDVGATSPLILNPDQTAQFPLLSSKNQSWAIFNAGSEKLLVRNTYHFLVS